MTEPKTTALPDIYTDIELVDLEKRDFMLCYYLERMPEDFNKQSVLDEAEQIWNDVTERCR